MSSNVSLPGQHNYANQTNPVNALSQGKTNQTTSVKETTPSNQSAVQNTNSTPAPSFAQALAAQQSGFASNVPSVSQDNLGVLEYMLDAYIQEMMSTFGGNAMSALSSSSTTLPSGVTGSPNAQTLLASLFNTQTPSAFSTDLPLQSGVDATTSTASPGGQILDESQLYSVATQAAQITGVPTSWVDNLVKIAMNESSGNPTAVNQGLTGDSEHAIGLMQTEPTTFNAYAAPGHTDITNPLDNMIAAVHYIKSRYGDAATALHKSLNGGY